MLNLMNYVYREQKYITESEFQYNSPAAIFEACNSITILCCID